jgi:cytochrome c oxidase cbb3-type subunit 3
MADFVNDFWHWFIVVISLVGILVLFPFIYMNRGQKNDGNPETMGHIWDDDLEEYNNPLPAWWFNLFLVTLVFGLVYLVLYPGLGHFKGVLNWTSTGQYEEEVETANTRFDPIYEQYAATSIPELSGNSEAMKTGKRLFLNYCAICHGSDGRGAPGFPNLRDDDWLYGDSPDQIKASILNGRSGVMPAWQAALGDDGVRSVTQFVLSLGDRTYDPELAQQGSEKYQQLCVACHQPDGSGSIQLGAPNLADDIWLYGGTRQAIAKSIASGRNGVMPANGEFLGEQRVHLLSAYVYSISRKEAGN